jgi:hypothetical protein
MRISQILPDRSSVHGMKGRARLRKLFLGLILALALSAFGVAPAFAEEAHPGWEVATPGVYPSIVAPNSTANIMFAVYNIGAQASSGAITVTDKLPPGLTAIEAGFFGREKRAGYSEGAMWKCSLGSVVTCVNTSNLPAMQSGDSQFLIVRVQSSGSVSGTGLNEVTVSGGGAAVPANTTNTIKYGSETPSFGLQNVDSWASNADGTVDTQAGSHPYSFTVSFFLNNTGLEPAGEMRDVVVGVPPGIIGDPQAVPRCGISQFNENACPADTQIGYDQPLLGAFPPDRPIETPFVLNLKFPLYNLVPPPGVPARFGFQLAGKGAYLDAAVRSGGDYGISEHVDNIPQDQITLNTITFWGVPGDPSHDYRRCTWIEGKEKCGLSSGAESTPLLTLPTECAGPQTTSDELTSWAPPGFPNSGISEVSALTHDNNDLATGYTGCDHLQFKPSISIAPDTSSTDSPAGLTVDVKMPQEGLDSPEGFSMSDIKNTTVTLPEGVVINPGQAAGLGACSDAQSAVGTEGEPSCPSSSKVGVDSIDTPLLPHKLEGGVYVLQSDPPDLKLLVAASGEGVNLKLIGHVHLNEQTGRLVTTFTETPQLPFTDFKLSFSGGAQAALATPTQCGTYTALSDFTPWSTPQVQDAFPGGTFTIDHGPGGSACPGGVLPFTPSLTAGATTDQAGGFTNFSMLLTRPDGQQRIDGLQFKAPQGLTGMLANVPLCTNAQAESNTCPDASQIGHTSVEAGPGPYPLVVPEQGQPQAPIYLTEGYEGAPFGLSIVVPLHVGPFTLPTQRVRARIEVDPNTAQLTITTDALPQVVAGVPTDLRAVDAVVDHADFIINPTNCEPQAFSGTAYGAPPPGAGGPNASASISTHFQVGSCQALKFTPKFAITTNGKTSKAGGAGLNVKLSFPNLPQGAQANVRTVKVDLPKQLPARLTTLQKACTEAQFNTNPAGCPAASIIGHAVAHTPILPVPLTGPAYFVSHGGAKFPELIMVLQGYGLTIMLHGETFINSKSGITSSTFHAVPDQPVSSFELTLPQGYNSALAANGNLCTSKMTMPTEFVGQNGAFIARSTPVAVTGCAKTKALTRAQKLARALKACHKQPKGSKRTTCERAARHKYGPVEKQKKK